jgi:hypothetical protein
MNVQAVVESCEAPARVAPEDALPWYKVVGIELGLFAGILASLIFGALCVR